MYMETARGLCGVYGDSQQSRHVVICAVYNNKQVRKEGFQTLERPCTAQLTFKCSPPPLNFNIQKQLETFYLKQTDALD